MAEKIVFVAFPFEDAQQRDLLKHQSWLDGCPFEYIDLSVKERYDSDWKTKVQTRIRRSHGVIALVSKNSRDSAGQRWEINCARAEGKKILAIWAYATDRTILPSVRTVEWSWPAIKQFIDGL